jgi:catechol 2,3-dioxygenase-like lactoylglutathione lyase family enzyme
MFTSISITTVPVLDQDQALDFYVGKLGFEVTNDVDMGFMRWLTIALPGDPGRHLLLEVPGPPALSEEVAGQVRGLLTKGALGLACVLTTDDCRKAFDELSARGVEFTEQPTEQPYGVDCALRDPFGNHIRITQPGAGPAEITDEDRGHAGRPVLEPASDGATVA